MKILLKAHRFKYFTILLATGVFLFLSLGSTWLFLQTFQRTSSSIDIDTLYNIHILLAMILLAIVMLFAWNAYKKYKRKQFGIVLTLKLAGFFMLSALLPGLMIYIISAQFVTQSIDTWFKTPHIEQGIGAGMDLGRDFFQRLLNEHRQQVVQINQDLANTGNDLNFAIAQLNQSSNKQNFGVFNEKGVILHGHSYRLTPAMIEQVQRHKEYAEVENDTVNQQFMMRVILPIPNKTGQYLQSVAFVPKQWADAVGQLTQAYQQHQSNIISRDKLKEMYHAMLSLSAFIALCGAAIFAFWGGNRITAPLAVLADNTQAVAAGDFRPSKLIQSGDEFGFLSLAFHKMTQQLSENRFNTQKARDYLEAIIGTMSSGMLIFDKQYRLLKYNQSAEDILGLRLHGYINQDISHPKSQLIQLSTLMHAMFSHDLRWEKADEYILPKGHSKHLLLKGSLLAYHQAHCYILVFDDIGKLISAQKTQAWAEVAQRLAHEIKNPLTPIQLSAERLQIKLEGKLDEKLTQMVHKSIQTITTQVQALKKLVDEFRHYARLPQAQMVACDLNELVREVVQLYQGVDHVEWNIELSAHLNPVRIDPEQIRQVLHNLIKNALEAMQDKAVQHHTMQKIHISTQWDDKSRHIHLMIHDTGPGFSAHIIDKVFEPYVTTKASGTGLGMAIVKKIMDENHAQIRIKNKKDPQDASGQTLGAEIHLWFKLFQKERNI